MAHRWDRLFLHADLATMAAASGGYGVVESGAVAVKDGRIAWLGPEGGLPGRPDGLATEVVDLDGAWVTPGLIDCHTHIVYGGNRAREFELRLEGASYEEIARAGGGIRSTVAMTRAASAESLLEDARARVRALTGEGVTTIEIKSGYGLNRESEIKMLEVARRLAAHCDVGVRTSFLGAHALPEEFDGRADAFIDAVCDDMLPAAAAQGLVDTVDAFCEGIAFSPDQVRRVFERARGLDIPVKLHAEQLSDLKGAVLAAEFGALSADHLEYVQDDGIEALARAGTVAVLLPGAYYFLRETRTPPVDKLRRHGVPIALASDSNPGSSPVTSLLLMLNMACTLFRMTPAEALAGVTRNAARALGIAGETGTLEPGKLADLAVWDIEHPAELAYRIGANPCIARIRHGRTCFHRAVPA